MMTEAEAKRKWCPFVRVVAATKDGSVTPPHNRAIVEQDKPNSVIIPSAAMCIGSACMAWRWENQGSAKGACGLASGR